MNQVSVPAVQNATTKHRKIHRTQPSIARKVIAFQELTNLEKQKKSARKAAELLEVPNSTMQSWRKQKIFPKASDELVSFFSTPVGADFLHRIVMSAIKLMKCGPGGIRGMKEYLHHSGLDNFVASSEGALQKFWTRCETHILEFGESEEKRLAATMRERRITVGLDEVFRSRRPCLVAIDVVSNYILLEKFTEDRTADTWIKELTPRLNDVHVKLSQVVSDLCGAIRSCTKKMGAVHIPELFHAQYEISKATTAALSSQEKSAENALTGAEERVQRIREKPRRLGEQDGEKRKQHEMEKASAERDHLKVEYEKKKKRRLVVRSAVREMGKIHHPLNLQTGKIHTADEVENRFAQQLQIVRENAQEAGLCEPSLDRIEKAKRAFDAIVVYMKYFFVFYAAFVERLKLNPQQENFFNEVVFPLCYLKVMWRRLTKRDKEAHIGLLKMLEMKMREAPWSAEFKQDWIKEGRELAETFQRSSSCVEGRNGELSLNHHRFHRLNERALKALTIVRNFDVRRWDGTTAAERFFEAKHANLFESLVENVRMPGKPQRQHHDLHKRLAGREKRLVA